jgi:hypothetical protein
MRPIGFIKRTVHSLLERWFDLAGLGWDIRKPSSNWSPRGYGDSSTEFQPSRTESRTEIGRSTRIVSPQRTSEVSREIRSTRTK